MRATPVDLIGGYYTDDALSWSCQDTVNWLPVMAEVPGTKTPKKLATPPGLKPYQQIGTGPIRGMHDLEGGRFVVSGRYLYRITPAGVGVPVGVIPGVGRVSMTHNQFKTGYQLLVENGQGGGGYVYTSSTDTLAKITDEGYPGSISSDYLDSYLLGVEPQGRYWFHSNLADATDYNTLDRYEAEAAPDRIVGLIVSAQEVVVFSQRTTEFFYNTGQNTGTFQNKKCGFDRGCASRHTIKNLDNSPIWLGDDGVVYRLDGYSAVPISTRPIEKALAGQNWSEAFAHTWEDRGFKIYYLTLPDGRTWGYDVVTRLWARRESPGLRRWRLMDTIRWGGKWYGGDFQDGRIWELNWDYYLEGAEEFISERTSPCLQDNRSNLTVPFAELEFDVGQGPMTEAVPFPEQPVPPTISGAAPDSIAGVAYPGFTYSISAGTYPVASVQIVSGALPAGLSIDNSGHISTATPTTAGVFSFTLRVTDTAGVWTEYSDSIHISPSSFLTLNSTGNTIRITTAPYDWTGVAGALPFSAALGIAACSPGKIIVAADAGVAMSSNNGVTWTPCTGIPGGAYAAILFNGTTWFAVPASGATLYKSTDGIAFTPQVYTALAGVVSNACISFENVIIISKGNSAGGARSTDGGLNWVNGGILSSVLNSVDRNPVTDVLLCATGQGGGPTYVVGKSINRGASWAYTPSPAASDSAPFAIRYGNGIWLMLFTNPYSCWRSVNDGASWVRVTDPNGAVGAIGEFNEFVFDGECFILCSDAFVQTTVDGTTWITRTSVSAKTIAVGA